MAARRDVTIALAASALLGTATLVAACRPGTSGPEALAAGKGAAIDRITVPPGFHVTTFTSAVSGARSLTLGAKGTVFVGTQSGSVYAVVDRNRDGVADQVFTIAKGLDTPNGVGFRPGALHVAAVGRGHAHHPD